MPPRKKGLQGYVRRRRKKTTKVVPPVEPATKNSEENSENEADYPEADDADDSPAAPAHIDTMNTEVNKISPARIHVVISSSSITDNQNVSALSPPLKMKFSTLSSVKITSPVASEKYVACDEPGVESMSHVEPCAEAGDEDEMADVVAEDAGGGKKRRPKATSTKRKKRKSCKQKAAEADSGVTTWAVSQCDEGPEQNSLRVRLRQRVKTVADNTNVPVVQAELVSSGSLHGVLGAVCGKISESHDEEVHATADDAAGNENSKDSCCDHDSIDEPRRSQSDVSLLENDDKQLVGDGKMLSELGESKPMVSQSAENAPVDSCSCDGRTDSSDKIEEVHGDSAGVEVRSVVSDSTKTGLAPQNVEMDTANASQESGSRSVAVRRRGKKNVKSSPVVSVEPRVTRSRRCGGKTAAVSDSKTGKISPPDVSKTDDASDNISEAAGCRLSAIDSLHTVDSSHQITADMMSAGSLPSFSSSSCPVVVKSNDRNAECSEVLSAVSTTSSIGHVASSTSTVVSSCRVIVSVPDVVVQSSVKSSMLDTAADCSVASTPDVIMSSVSSKTSPSPLLAKDSPRAAHETVSVNVLRAQSINCTDELKPGGAASRDNPSTTLPARVEDSTVTEHHDVETTVDEVPLKKRRIRRFDLSEVTDGSDIVINDTDAPCAVRCDVELRVGVKNNTNVPNTPRHIEPRGNMYVGAHTSVTGNLVAAVQAASRLGSRAFGIFIKNQSQLLPPALDFAQALAFKQALKTHGYLPHLVVPHASYLLNCGADDPSVLSQSRKSLVDDLERCRTLGLSLFNFHPGSFKSSSTTVDECLRRIAESINYAHSRVDSVTTVLENMCGQRNTVGGRFTELRQIINQVKDQTRVGVCLDTCHAFAAGYDLRREEGYKKMMEDFEQTIGLSFLKVIHVNDSKDDIGSHTDHHVNIGKGRIGLDCFRWIMNDARLQRLPIILETPLGSHKSEIELLYSLVQ